MLYSIITICIIVIFVLTFIIVIEKRKNNKILKLYNIGNKISSNITIKALINEIMEIVQTEAEAESGSLYLIDEEKEELYFEVALGEKKEEVKKIRLKIGDGIAGWVAKEGKILNIKDVNKDYRFKRQISDSIKQRQKSMLTMPVKYKDNVIGVLQLINKKGGKYFTNNDEKLVEAICGQIAVALTNAKLYEGLKTSFIEYMASLADAIDAKDAYTNGHSTRVTEYSVEIAKEMGLDEDKIEKIQYMALMHDVGKIGISDTILNKCAPLDNDEFVIMKTHTELGFKILQNMSSMKELSVGALYHHEKYNGSGYMNGLKGEEIPFEARIIAVADAFDAMTTDRPYRKGLSIDEALTEINNCSGTHFDPEVVKYFNIVIGGKTKLNAS